MKSFETRFELSAKKVIKKGDRIMVCVSGGPDSTALFYLMKKYCENAGAKIYAAHFNHKFRGKESDKDAEFVRKTAAGEGIEFIYGELGAKTADTSEDFARKARYSFFIKECRKRGINKIAAGHTMDDNAETVLFRFVKGSGAKGLSGIPAKRKFKDGEFGIKNPGNIELIRPFINLDKKSIMEWLSDSGIPFRLDRTNFTDKYERNIIRNKVMPLLESRINRGVKKALTGFAELYAMDEEFFEKRVKSRFDRIVTVKKGEVSMDRKKFLLLHPAEGFRVLSEAIKTGTGKIRSVDLMCVKNAYEGIKTGKGSNLPGDMVIRVEEEAARIQPVSAKKEKNFNVKIEKIPQKIRAGNRVYTVETIKNSKKLNLKDRKTAHIDAGRVKKPLYIRSRKPGDRFMPYGMTKEVKLKDFLTAAKTDKNVHLLCDLNGIIWIADIRVDERVKVTQNTEYIIRIKYKDIDGTEGK